LSDEVQAVISDIQRCEGALSICADRSTH
jgi:hypothetical protein